MIPLAQLFDLRGRVAAVTGAGQGIGAAIAHRLAEAGAMVAIIDRDVTLAQSTAAAIQAAGGVALAVAADIGDRDAARQAIDQSAEHFGRLDILVANAGIYPFAAALHLDDPTWDQTLAVNLTGAFACAQTAAQIMVAAGSGGRIILISSISAHRSSGNLAHYDATKAALEALTRALALEWGQYAITINALAPGEIDTPGTRTNAGDLAQPDGATVTAMSDPAFLAHIPLGRLGTPDDIARVALFLASDAAAYMTGSIVTVDGGYGTR